MKFPRKKKLEGLDIFLINGSNDENQTNIMVYKLQVPYRQKIIK
jgi:hypothetical protein